MEVGDRPQNFITVFKILDRNALESVLLSTYFALTSLSTIGLGDVIPKNNVERVSCSAMLLFGVAIFSYVMNNFLDLVAKYESYTGDFDEG